MNKKNLLPHIHKTIMRYTSSYEIAADYDNFFKNNKLFITDCEFMHDMLTPPGKILDLGCGTGRHLLFLESLGFTLFGIDLSKHFLDQSINKFARYGAKPAKLIQADILNLPLNKSAKFEGILLMFSILGLIQGRENRIKLLKSLSCHLNDNGKIILHVHNYNFRYSTLIRKILNFSNNINNSELKERGDKIIRNYRNIQDLYIHSFTLAELDKIFTESGYRIEGLMGLNAERDGICEDKDININANGFLISLIKNC